MFRKIVTILALLCFLAAGNSAMGYGVVCQTFWNGGAADANWFTAGNWNCYLCDNEPPPICVPGPNSTTVVSTPAPGQ